MATARRAAPAQWRALASDVLMTRTFDPVVQRFIEAIRRALPDCDERDLYWAYHFLSGALTLTFAETGRINNAKRPARRKTKR